MTNIRKTLNVTLESPYFDEAYRRASGEAEIPEWLTEAFIRKLNDTFHVLPRTFEKVLEALPHVVAVPELCLFANTLYYILATRAKYSKAFTALTLPEAPVGSAHTVGYDCVALFPVLAHVMLSWDELVLRGVGEDVATDSLRWIDGFFAEACEKSGKICFPKAYFSLYGVGIYTESLIIGRLRFEPMENVERPVRIFRNEKGNLLPLMENTMIHQSGHILGSYGCEDEAHAYSADFTETDTAYEGYTVDSATGLVIRERIRLSKNEWTPVFSSGVSALKVHIPFGGSLSPASVKDSYLRAKEIYTRCYPQYRFSCFLLVCWMLSPLLKEILSPSSNIVSFAKDYTVFPVKNNALDGFLYVFDIQEKSVSDIDIETLPENNSLQRGMKRKAREGKLVYQFGGYMPWEIL